MKSHLLHVIRLCTAGLFVSATVNAALVNFESIPGGIASDGLVINNQFLATDGVSFQLENGNFPVLAQVGGTLTAFAGPPNDSGNDTVANGQNVGQYFLTDDGVLGNGPASPLIISYDLPTSEASGVILDIDNSETWTIQARDVSDTVLSTIILSAGAFDTGDGIATPWSFDLSKNDIFSIRISGVKSINAGFGLGFDNFNSRSASIVPVPAAAWFFGTGLLGLIGIFRSKKLE